MRFFRFLFKTLNVFRLIILNLLFWGFLAGIIVVLIKGTSDKEITSNALSHSKKSVLELSLRYPLRWEPLLSEDGVEPLSLPEIRLLLSEAKEDSQIEELVIRVADTFSSSPATLSDLRDFLQSFQESGKVVTLYGKNLSQAGYYIGAGADKILLDPEGALLFKGLSSTSVFFGEFLTRYGLEPTVIREGAFKSAVEPYTRDSYSEEARANTLSWMNDIWGRFLTTIAEDRKGVKREDLINYTQNYLPLLNEQGGTEAELAETFLLVDELRSVQEIEEEYEEKIWKEREYLGQNSPDKKKEVIAVLPIQGTLSPNLNGYNPLNVDGETLSLWIEEVEESKEVKGVLFVIDSPGGAVSIAEKIRDDITELTDSERPIVGYFAGVAASGGYWVATPFTDLYSSANTITGSIGVFAVLPQLSNFANQWGVYGRSLSTTPYGNLYNPLLPPSEAGLGLLESRIGETYTKFKRLVSENRGWSRERTERFARGRVYSGKQAEEIGLIDKTATFNQTLDHLVSLIDPEKSSGDYSLEFYRRTPPFFYELLEKVELSTGMSQLGELREFTTLLKRANRGLKSQERENIERESVEARLPLEVSF